MKSIAGFSRSVLSGSTVTGGPPGTGAAIEGFKRWRIQKECAHGISSSVRPAGRPTALVNARRSTHGSLRTIHGEVAEIDGQFRLTDTQPSIYNALFPAGDG